MNKNVLYIEDNADNMLLVKRVLESRGYTVLEARNGIQGLSMAEFNDVDLKGDAEKALEAGCDVYMSKPINVRELWARVEGFVSSPE
jgi:two-component system cell cycle response regulator DivK